MPRVSYPTRLPHSISIWNFGMFSLEQIGASLPRGSEDPTLIFLHFFKKIKNYTTRVYRIQRHRQTDGRTGGRLLSGVGTKSTLHGDVEMSSKRKGLSRSGVLEFLGK